MSSSPGGALAPNPNTPDSYASDRNAAIYSLVIGVLLMGVKFAAYLLTDSSAIFSDAMESIVNVLASGFALWAIGYSYQPADDLHPYGHGKVEFVSAALEGAMILLAAAVILLRTIQQFFLGGTLDQLEWGVMLIVIAMLANGAMGMFLLYRGRRSGSIALEADGHHLLSDAVTSAVVLVTLVAVRLTGWGALDPICALLVTAYIAWVGIALVRRSAGGLMDEQDPSDDLRIRALIDGHVGPAATQEPRVCSYHKLRHRHTGRYHWVDFHLVVPADWGIARAHEVASVIEGQIESELGHADATAHVEPCISPSCGICHAGRTQHALGSGV